MRCPKCNGVVIHVIDSRPVDDTTKRRRRYECLHCEEVRFSTIEIPVREYEALWQQSHVTQDNSKIDELKLIITWLLRSIFSENMNNNYLKLKRYVANPSQEMQKRLKQIGIDITSYQ